MQTIGKQLCKVQSAKRNKQSATQSLCEHFLDICRTQLLSYEPSAQPTLENYYQNCTRLDRIFYYCAGLNRIAYIYKLLHIDQLGKWRSCKGWHGAQLCLHWISYKIVQNYLELHRCTLLFKITGKWDPVHLCRVAWAQLCKCMGWILYNCTRLNRIILYNCRALHITTNYCTLTKRNVRLWTGWRGAQLCMH